MLQSYKKSKQVRISPELHRALKMEAAELGVTVRKLLDRILGKYYKNIENQKND